MLNIIGGALIFLSSVYIGYGIFSIYAARMRFLEEFRSFIDFAEGEIGFFKTEFDGLVRKFSDKHPSDFAKILLCVQGFHDNKPPAWLNESLRDVLEEFLRGVQELDRDSQKLFFERYRAQIIGMLQKQEQERDTKGKTVKKLCPLLGLAVFVIIL